MREMTYTEILKMVQSACKAIWYDGTEGVHQTVLESATQIYIAQMKGGERDGKTY